MIGSECSVNGSGDLHMEVDARKFIGQKCQVIKTTRGGLIQVSLMSDPKKIMSFPKRNIDFI